MHNGYMNNATLQQAFNSLQQSIADITKREAKADDLLLDRLGGYWEGPIHGKLSYSILINDPFT